MNEAPYRLCCGQQHTGPVCPDGKIMCCLCFERVERDQLHVDEKNQTWDICKTCQEGEVQAINQRANGQ